MPRRNIPLGQPTGSMLPIGECATAIARGVAVNKNTSTGAAELATSGFPDGVTKNAYAAEAQVAGQAFGFAMVKVNGLSSNVAYHENLILTTGGIGIPAASAGDAIYAISYEPETVATDGAFILALLVRLYKHA